MTTLQHNKYLALAHVAYGVLNVVLMAAVTAWFLATAGTREETVFLVIGLSVVNGFNLIYTLPSFVAGYALLRRRPWARGISLAGGALAAMYFPFGPFVCAYSFWFMFNAPGKALYENGPRTVSLPEEGQVQYFPPSSPPDWR